MADDNFMTNQKPLGNYDHGIEILLRRRKLIGDYIPYRRLIVYYAVFEREGVVCEWL